MLRAAAFVLGMTALAAGATQIKPWGDRETPALARLDLTGKVVDLKDLRGRVVLVNFWATWCDPCREEMPSLERLRARLEGRPFELLTVNFGESTAKISAFMEKHKIALPVLLDPEKESAAAWRAGGLPITFLVDKDGRVRFSAFGECDWSEGELYRVVESLVNEGPRARR